MKNLLFYFLLCSIFNLYGQDPSDTYLVQADSTWGKEIIKFPIEWAPKLTLQGYEELTFAPEWSNAAHEEFWSLIMVWKVHTNNAIPLYELQFNLLHYFDYLMKPNHWASEFPLPQATFKTVSETNKTLEFTAELTFFDGFHTGKVITVNLLGQQVYNQKKEESIISFKISPKAYSDAIWKKLNTLKIKTE